ncbi:MAG: hypothetical protein IPG68_09865 [Micrococcales bacterium]|nr:hypothetical protein [Micrococcales bacterium]
MITQQEVTAWLTGRLGDWFEDFDVVVDREEITVVGRLPGEGLTDAAAQTGRITRFREQTRDERIAIARELERATGRKVAWGARCGDTERIFTRLSVPVMTRLKQDDRRVLDTLVAAGVARSRSDALAWCVRLVGQHEAEWLDELRQAMRSVDRVREQGPTP